MNSSMKELWGSSHISSGHAAYLESLYEVFLNNPKELTEDWREFFSNLSEGDLSKDISHKEIIDRFKNLPRVTQSLSKNSFSIDERQGKVIRLIQAYRNRGHQKAKLDPLGMMERNIVEDLNLEFHGLSTTDLDEEFYTDTLATKKEKLTLREIVQHLEDIYCGYIGIECNHIIESSERRWFQRKFETKLQDYKIDNEQKTHIFERLCSAEAVSYTHLRAHET